MKQNELSILEFLKRNLCIGFRVIIYELVG